MLACGSISDVHTDTSQRSQYRNAQNTFAELLEMGVIPIVNENDTIAVTEIKFGDNDTLSAITAAMVHADYLFLMTDVDCLYDKNPRTNPDAQAIEVVEDIAALTADGTYSFNLDLFFPGFWCHLTAIQCQAQAPLSVQAECQPKSLQLASLPPLA